MRLDPGAFERSLAKIERRCKDPVHGIFGPGTANWELGKDVSIYLGAGRAVLLQLAHPYVAYGIEDHSVTRTDPIGRFYRTFDVVYGIVFGDLPYALRAARGTFFGHSRVVGTIREDVGRFKAGDRYDGLDLDALQWVWATLIHTAIVVQERVRGRLPEELRERYYEESKTFAVLFGVPEERLPARWADFDRYFEETVASDMIAVSQPAREMCDFLLSPTRPEVRVPMTVLRAVTAELMPPKLRREFGFEWGAKEKLLARTTFEAARVAHRVLPSRVRQVPAYTEALNRIAGHPGPDVVGRKVEAAVLEFVGPRA